MGGMIDLCPPNLSILRIAISPDLRIIRDLLTKVAMELSRNVQSGNTQNLKSSAAPVRLPAVRVRAKIQACRQSSFSRKNI